MTAPLTPEELAELRAIPSLTWDSKHSTACDMARAALPRLLSTIDARDAELATLRARVAAMERVVEITKMKWLGCDGHGPEEAPADDCPECDVDRALRALDAEPPATAPRLEREWLALLRSTAQQIVPCALHVEQRTRCRECTLRDACDWLIECIDAEVKP